MTAVLVRDRGLDGAIRQTDGAIVVENDVAGTRPLFVRAPRNGAGGIVSDALADVATAEVDERWLAARLTGRVAPPGVVAPAGVRAVPASTTTTLFADGGWSERIRSAPPPTDPPTRDDLLRRLRAACDDVVRSSASAVGVHLSGGLDSSLVAALVVESARRLGAPTPIAFTWLPTPGTVDSAGRLDERLVQLAAEHLELECRHAPVAPWAVDAWLAMDPLTVSTTSTLLHELPVLAAAEAVGVDVLVSGWGGDECVSHRHRSPQQRLRRRLRWWRGRRARRRAGPGYAVARIAAQRNERPLPEHVHRLVTSPHLGERTHAWAEAGRAVGIRHAFPLLDDDVLGVALHLPRSERGRGRDLVRWLCEGLLPAAIRDNDDKSDPVRFASYVAVTDEVLTRAGTALTVDPRRRRHVDVARIARVLAAGPPFPQPGKLMSALQWIHDPDGLPLDDVVGRT